MTYKKRLTIIFLFTSIIPMLMLQIYLVGRYSHQQKDKISVLITDNLFQKKNTLEQEVEDFRNLMFSLMTEEKFTETINKMESADPESRSWLQSQIIDILFQTSYLKKGLAGIVYFNSEGKILINYNKFEIREDDIFQHEGGLEQIIQRIEEKGGGISVFRTENMKGPTQKTQSIILMGSRFSDLNRTEWSGYIFLLIDEKEIHNLLNPPKSFSDGIFSYTFLHKNTGEILSFSNKEVFSSTKNALASPLNFFINNYIEKKLHGKLVSRTIAYEKMDLQLTSVFLAEELYGDVSFFRIYTLTIGLMATLLTIYFFRKYLIHLTDAILELRNSMKIENDELHFDVSSKDDLDYLNHSFNQMKHTIDKLLREQSDRNVQLLQIQEERRQAEIRAIEAQVNPHFLYNTLNSLNWMAIDREDMEMSQALTDLAEILRYSISRIDTLTTVEEEIQWLKKYLSLQQLRFDTLFEYFIEVDENIKQFTMYKLLFQPYIENALIHGFHGIKYKGKLHISIVAANDSDIKVCIKDNGTGFNPMNINKESIGMESSAYRMNLYYKGKASFQCRSNPDKGTEIIIMLPKVKT